MYGGTQSEMQRLVKHAAEVDKSIDANSLAFDNIVRAIRVVQDEMGITGTTALEAGRTISGSVGAMKSAWTNLVTGFADGNADIEGLINNLVTTIVGDGTKNNLGVIGNVLPAVERALGGIVQLIAGAAPKIIEILPGLVTRIVPSLISAATGMVDEITKVLPDLLNTIVDSIIKNAPLLIDSALSLVGELVSGILKQLPQIVKLGLDLIVSLANGIAESLPELIPTIVDVILQIVEVLTNQETLTSLLSAALTIIKELAWGITNNIDKIIDAIFLLIDGIIDFLVKPENLMMLIETAIELVMAIATGIVKAIPRIITAVLSLIGSIFSNFATADWGKIGKDLVDGLKNGISNAWTNLKKWFKNLFGDLIGIAKKILGIASPSKVFKKIGGFTAEGFGTGFEDEFSHIKDDMEDALNFDDASVGINASIRKVGAGAAGGAFGGTSIGNITINIDGAKYTDEHSLASAIALEIQNMTDRRAAVYA